MPQGISSEGDLLAGNFQILEPLDDGARVFKAHDRRHRRVVAVRRLPTASGRDPTALGALRLAVRAAARVEHPNLAVASDIVEDRGVAFAVMPLVEGSDLGRIVRDRGPMAIGQAIDVVKQAASGLAAAHARGIVHGAIRPSQLMLDRSGTVRVLGLGLSSPTVADRSDPDPEGAGFMAPEVAEEPRRPDPRADVFGLGCVLHFLLTGRAPSGAESVRDRPGVPSALKALCQKMVAVRPDDRPGSMVDVLGLIESIERSVPGGPGRSPPADPGRRDRRRAATADRPARVVSEGDEAAGVPIGPEFDLTDLGIEGRPGAGPGPPPAAPGRRAIGARFADSRPTSRSRSAVSVAVAVVGIAAIALAAWFGRRPAPRSDESGSRPIAPTSAADRVGPAKAGGAKPHPPSPSEWAARTIFDGRSAGDWMLASKRPLPARHVQPDGLNPHGTGSYLVVYRHRLGDFLLDFDYKLSPGCDTGVFLRVGDLDDPVHTGIEVSISDRDGTGDEAPGAIRGLVAPSVNAQKPSAQWNHMTIQAEGPEIEVSLNGQEVSRIDLDARSSAAHRPRRGYLGFQDLVGDCWFRNVVLRAPEFGADRPGRDPDR